MNSRGRRFLCVLTLVVAALAGCSSPPPPVVVWAPPPVTHETLRLETDAGPIVIMLYPEAAPKTVELMKKYVAENYYVGRAFYRTVPGHVIQITDASGGATDDSRRVPLETSPSFHFSAGAVGIARDVDPNSGGPEFFIMDFATSHLDGNFTVWGQVIEGMDVVHTIARAPTIDAPRAPAGLPNPFPFDSMAIQPVTITATKLDKTTMPGAEASHYPLQVARNVRVGDYRHSLEAPGDLTAGHEALLSWFVRPYNGSPVPEPSAVSIHVDGQTITGVGHAAVAPGMYTFRWTPSGAGDHHLSFWVDNVAWATLDLEAAASI